MHIVVSREREEQMAGISRVVDCSALFEFMVDVRHYRLAVVDDTEPSASLDFECSKGVGPGRQLERALDMD